MPDKEKEYRVIEGVINLTIAEDTEKYETILVDTSYRNRPMGLYQVILKYKSRAYTMMVIAESEEGAIQQVNDVPLDSRDMTLGNRLVESGEMVASATRIPMYIRGWGFNRTF